MPARDPQGGPGEVPPDGAAVQVHPHKVLLLGALQISGRANEQTVEITQNRVEKQIDTMRVHATYNNTVIIQQSPTPTESKGERGQGLPPSK